MGEKMDDVSRDGKIDVSGAPSIPYFERAARTEQARAEAGVTREPFEDQQTKDTRSNLEKGEALAQEPEVVGSEATEEEAAEAEEASEAAADESPSPDEDVAAEGEEARFEDEGGTPSE